MPAFLAKPLRPCKKGGPLVDETTVTALETAIADLGALIVQVDKFRAGDADDARALRAACLAMGDRARRAHRRGALDEALARELLADAEAARTSLAGWLGRVRHSAPYRAAVAALAAGDDAVLRASLATLYAGVAVAPAPDALFHQVAWQRRGRPRPAADVARELARLRADGLPGDGDAEAPGVDPALPGVLFHREPPPGAPVFLALRGDACPPWVLALPTGDVVVPGAIVRVPFVVATADPDAEDLDAWTLDPLAFRDELVAALRAEGVPLDA
jgi:hypothetical protein